MMPKMSGTRHNVTGVPLVYPNRKSGTRLPINNLLVYRCTPPRRGYTVAGCGPIVANKLHKLHNLGRTRAKRYSVIRP